MFSRRRSGRARLWNDGRAALYTPPQNNLCRRLPMAGRCAAPPAAQDRFIRRRHADLKIGRGAERRKCRDRNLLLVTKSHQLFLREIRMHLDLQYGRPNLGVRQQVAKQARRRSYTRRCCAPAPPSLASPSHARFPQSASAPASSAARLRWDRETNPPGNASPATHTRARSESE